MDNESLAPENRFTAPEIPHIGAFVLETLTLGMYGEPRHTLREYVQNSFDSIRAAQRTKFLSDRGRITITVTPEALFIRDNGLGVPAALAWRTLTAIGASKKDRARDAGFRGIGRLAGMAYCDELIFRTTFPEEATLSTIRFDCVELREAMSPGLGGEVELGKLLASAIRFESKETTALDEHFFEVELRGLQNAPASLVDPEKVRQYLSETVPVDFNPDWPRGSVIGAEYKAFFGEALETVEVFVTADGETQQIFKPYSDTYALAKGTARLQELSYVSDSENRYWGWIGRLNQPAAVTDWRTRGLRLRVRNIQVGRTEIFESLFTNVRASYGRFSAYYVGEIHVSPDVVVPNARRDGFEETEQWELIKASLISNVCRPLAKDAYSASKDKQSGVQKVVEDIDKLVERGRVLAESSSATYDQVVELLNAARNLRRRASSALKRIDGLEEAAQDDSETATPAAGVNLEEATRDAESVESQARMLIARFLDDDERIAGLRARLREEIVAELLGIINAFVDSATYQKIKRHFAKSA